MGKTITGHMVVKNEERWVWYSIMSVINYLDKMIIFDNGSTDKTPLIIKEILKKKEYKKKIIFEEKGSTNKSSYTRLRQEQLDRTDTDYFMIVDGDEIWWEDSIKEVIGIINSENPPELIATRFINCAGDIYHYRDDKRETYCINGITGAISIRVFSLKIKGIHCNGEYGNEGYVDFQEKTVQNNIWKTKIQKGYFLHTSYLQRSGSMKKDKEVYFRDWKIKHQNLWDHRFPKQYLYPEVFYYNTPQIVHRPWDRAGIYRRFMQIKKIKRLLKI